MNRNEWAVAPKPTIRRTGVMTVACHACLKPNGIKIGMQFYDSKAIYECWNCNATILVEVEQRPMILSKQHGVFQKGVKVHGK